MKTKKKPGVFPPRLKNNEVEVKLEQLLSAIKLGTESLRKLTPQTWPWTDHPDQDSLNIVRETLSVLENNLNWLRLEFYQRVEKKKKGAIQ